MKQSSKVLFAGIVFILFIILFATNTTVSIHTLETDIRILESQNNILTAQIQAIRTEQEQFDSRLRFTATVKELELLMIEIEDCKATTKYMVTANRTINEILFQMFGEVPE